MKFRFAFLSLAIFSTAFLSGQGSYKNFKVSVYTRAYEVQRMEDKTWLDSTWKIISSQIEIDKIYLETHRDMLIVDQKTLKQAIKYFTSLGIEVAGGITYTINEGNLFETYCYSNPEQRQKVKEIIEYSAKNFDEVILDDFFFTSCKCDLCMKAKGDRNWQDYRLELMTEAAVNLVLGPARAVNPKVKVVVKYPNWYDHFQELGFNLETQPSLFDGLYTGTETRDAVRSNQHLQQYHGFLIFRYFENLKPGKNGGGWVDTGGMRYFDRYAEQLWLTLFAKASEMTLFDYRQMLSPMRNNAVPEWKDKNVSFDYQSILPLSEGSTMAGAAAHSLNIVDKVIGYLGNPVGIKSYKPYHSSGEDFLQNYLGMIGIPMDIVPEFPEEDRLILLTEQAAHDPDLLEKMTQRIREGKDIVITSGLLRVMQDRGIDRLVNLKYTDRKSIVKDFLTGWQIVEGDTEIIIPQIQYFTNDSWETISAMDNGLGWPFFHMARIGNATLYLLTVPENFADLYSLPVEVLNRIRQTLCGPLGITLAGPSKVALFPYDNDTYILESFNDEEIQADIFIGGDATSFTDPASGKKHSVEIIPAVSFGGRTIVPERHRISLTIPPHSFLVLTGKK